MEGPKAETVIKLKEKGNACVREEKYEEAIFHYSHALKLDPLNYSIYSNRSLAFLKMQQYYLSMADALQTIKIAPEWAKGYFRKGEVEFATFHFSEALSSYGKALARQRDDPNIRHALTKTTQGWLTDRRADEQIPWLGAGVGIIIGVVIVISDQTIAPKPTLTHPIIMALLTISIALIGYAISKGIRYYVKCQRKSLLEPPLDLLPEESKPAQSEDGDDEEEGAGHHKSPRFTKAQARQRFKKGKS
ncbi:protein STIP1 homolog [Thrips palmi]|uniref:Protein STIP1 homolog n=1 Tax=Thrips palmi TaxID=161013 RepID=A0A6P8Y2U2_THRPL|nr:protein STIP1 homolog [Thrips palmi]